MQRTTALSTSATRAHRLVSSLQQRFVDKLTKLAEMHGSSQRFTPVKWYRDEGIHGGGIRFETADGDLFGRGSVNVSQVHYDDNPEKRLGSASAISTIIHPVNPLAPSVHIHISWTEMKDGSGYWRIMADLNPSNAIDTDREQFLTNLKNAAPEQFDEATAQGERYFFIPVLNRHRGVAHFYLENYTTGDREADYRLAKAVGEAAIDGYVEILSSHLSGNERTDDVTYARQLAYHTLYFFQVLTLDRGTTTGLLVHNQNDVGIMGSLPAYVDKKLLESWIGHMQPPQDELLKGLIDALPQENPAPVDETTKTKLAEVVRRHYTAHPEAIAMQASGDVIPPTVQNHQD